MISHERQVEEIAKILASLQEAGFYGQLTAQLRNGNVVITRIEQTVKMDDLCRDENQDGRNESVYVA